MRRPGLAGAEKALCGRAVAGATLGPDFVGGAEDTPAGSRPFGRPSLASARGRIGGFPQTGTIDRSRPSRCDRDWRLRLLRPCGQGPSPWPVRAGVTLRSRAARTAGLSIAVVCAPPPGNQPPAPSCLLSPYCDSAFYGRLVTLPGRSNHLRRLLSAENAAWS